MWITWHVFEVSSITNLNFVLWKPPKMRLLENVKKNGDTEVVLG